MQRVFRIVPDENFYYPSMGDIVVQPLESIELTQLQCSYVREMEVIVESQKKPENATTSTPGQPLRQISMIVFRDPNTKNKTSTGTESPLPLGEGNGKYSLQKLMNPRINTYESEGATGFPVGKNLFETEYEHLDDVKMVNNSSYASFPALLSHFKDYWIEACTGNDLGVVMHYKATFQNITPLERPYSGTEDPAIWYTGTKIPDPVNKVIQLAPLPSRLLIRTQDDATKQALPNARVYVSKTKIDVRPTSTNTSVLTDKNGDAEMLVSDLPLNNIVTSSNPTVHVRAYSQDDSYEPSSPLNFTINMTGSQGSGVLTLQPAGVLQIKVYESTITKGREAYIGIDSANWKPTNQNGNLTLRVPAKASTKIHVKPADLAYFDEEFTLGELGVNVASNNYTVNVPVQRKKHRINIWVKNDQGNAISYATVALGDSVKLANASGLCKFEFENVSEKYAFVVRGPANLNYIPVVYNVTNHESREPKEYEVKLEAGSSIQGTVKLNGAPVRNAKVYVDASLQTTPPSPVGSNPDFIMVVGTGIGNTNFGSQDRDPDIGSKKTEKDLLIAYTNANGQYTIRGVPVTDNNAKIDVIATLDTTFTVVGGRATATIQNKTATANLNITSYAGMYINNLYGFPLTVEELTPVGNNVKVTGLIDWSDGLNDFSLLTSYERLRVEDVVFRPDPANPAIGVADGNPVLLNVTSMKLGYLNDKYHIQLTSSQSQSGPGNTIPTALSIERSNGRGSIGGKMQIVDNSFNYTQSYLNFTLKDNFYLATKNASGTLNNIIRPVVSPQVDGQNAGNATAIGNRYYLSNATGGPIEFHLLEFKAIAKPDSSFIDPTDKKIHLNVELDAHIPHAQPENLTVKIPDMVLDDHRVYPQQGSKPLVIALGEWNLEVADWEFSPTKGGIFSNKAVIRTKVVDIPINGFVLRNDMFMMPTDDIGNLTIGGGVTKVEIINGGTAALLWDRSTGNFMDGHWRFSITGKSGQPAARTTFMYIPKTANSSTSEQLNIDYLQILDNNSVTLQLSPNQTRYVRGNALAKFTPQSLLNGPNYVDISGSFNIVGAPAVPDMLLTLNYTGQPGNQTMVCDNVTLDFIPRVIHFTADTKLTERKNIVITSNQIVIDGEVSEKPVTFNKMPAKFIATASPKSYEIKITPNWTMQLSHDTGSPMGDKPAEIRDTGFKLDGITGGTKVENNNWELLTYTGTMIDNTAGEGLVPPTMTFTVNGAVQASSESVGFSGLSTPFGEFRTTYDFGQKALIGSLTVKKTPVPIMFGPLTIKSGTINFRNDRNGFYVAGSLLTDIDAPPIVVTNIGLGLMFGKYNSKDQMETVIWPAVTQNISPLVKNYCYPEQIRYKLAGFYFTIDKTLFKTHLKYTVPLTDFGFKLNGEAAIAADFYANFGENTNFGIGARARLKVSAEFNVLVGGIEGSLDAAGAFNFVVVNNKFEGSAQLDMTTSARAWVLGGDIFNGSIDLHAKISNTGSSFNFGSGSSTSSWTNCK